MLNSEKIAYDLQGDGNAFAVKQEVSEPRPRPGLLTMFVEGTEVAVRPSSITD